MKQIAKQLEIALTGTLGMIHRARLLPAFSVLVLALGLAPHARAACGGFLPPRARPSSWLMQYGQPQLIRTAFDDDDGNRVSIVGFWHVKFISNGKNWGLPPGVTLPDGFEFDAGYSQWHSDGTEFNNSGGRAPDTGNFCLGMWAQVGPRQYKLNHFGTPWDPTQGEDDSAGNPMGVLIGPANIKEVVTVSRDDQSFSGTFTIDQYDESMNHLSHIEGTVLATRVTVDTPPSPVF